MSALGGPQKCFTDSVAGKDSSLLTRELSDYSNWTYAFAYSTILFYNGVLFVQGFESHSR